MLLQVPAATTFGVMATVHEEDDEAWAPGSVIGCPTVLMEMVPSFVPGVVEWIAALLL